MSGPGNFWRTVRHLKADQVSVSNPGKLPPEIIEVQSGSYLGEDGIVRLEDSYGRQ